MGNQLWECFNKTILVEKDINEWTMKPIGCATQINHTQLVLQGNVTIRPNFSFNNVVSYRRMYKLEVTKLIRKDKTADVLMYALAVILTFIGMLPI